MHRIKLIFEIWLPWTARLFYAGTMRQKHPKLHFILDLPTTCYGPRAYTEKGYRDYKTPGLFWVSVYCLVKDRSLYCTSWQGCQSFTKLRQFHVWSNSKQFHVWSNSKSFSSRITCAIRAWDGNWSWVVAAVNQNVCTDMQEFISQLSTKCCLPKIFRTPLLSFLAYMANEIAV